MHAPDRARLKREGFKPYVMQWTGSGGRKQAAPVYAQRIPTLPELRDGADRIFGAGGTGSVRLLEDGNSEKTTNYA
ncbi:MAG: hypothetical protein M3Z30_00860 [Gemmatimonadota bacterium]|nr:hypothetical protein [Gemmatimonadota bacterium]